MHSQFILAPFSSSAFLLQFHTAFVIQCVHCDVDAYYRLTIEDFNKADSYSLDLCIKCIKIEAKKIIDDIPSIKSLKIEPVLSVSANISIS
jgi:hypothetical protein